MEQAASPLDLVMLLKLLISPKGEDRGSTCLFPAELREERECNCSCFQPCQAARFALCTLWNLISLAAWPGVVTGYHRAAAQTFGCAGKSHGGSFLSESSGGWCCPYMGRAVPGCPCWAQGECWVGRAGWHCCDPAPWAGPGQELCPSPGTVRQGGVGSTCETPLGGCCTPQRMAGPRSAPLSPLNSQLRWALALGASKTEITGEKNRISASNYLDLLLLLYCLGWARFMDPEFKLGLEAKVLLQPWDPERGKEETSTLGEGEEISIWIHLESQLLPCRYKEKPTVLALNYVHFQDGQLLIINPVAGWSIETDVPKEVLFSKLKRMKLHIRQIKKKFKYLHPVETRCWKNRQDKIAAIKCNLIYNSESMFLPKADFEFSLWSVLLWCTDFPDFLWHFNQQPNDVIIFLKQKNKWHLFRHN